MVRRKSGIMVQHGITSPKPYHSKQQMFSPYRKEKQKKAVISITDMFQHFTVVTLILN
jgi:hypothetical protein